MRVKRQLATRDTQQVNVVSQCWQQTESMFEDGGSGHLDQTKPVIKDYSSKQSCFRLFVRQMLSDPNHSVHLPKTNLRR